MGARLFSVYTNVTQNVLPSRNKYYFIMNSEVYSCIAHFLSSKLLYVVSNRTKLLLLDITSACHKCDMAYATHLPRWWILCTQVTHATFSSLGCYMVHFMVYTSNLLVRSSMHKIVTIFFINYNTLGPKQEPLSLEPAKKR